jgi:hypothetical protein
LEGLSQARDITLVIDRTMIKNRLNVLMVSVAVHHRVLPLVWKVQKKQGSFQLRYVQAALRFVVAWAPWKAHIWVVGDREFQDVAFQTFVRDEMGWQFVQRLDQSTELPARAMRLQIAAERAAPR